MGKHSDSKHTESLYKTALKIRIVEEEIAARYSQREMRSPTHLYIGEEAIATGVCAHLNKADILVGQCIS